MSGQIPPPLPPSPPPLTRVQELAQLRLDTSIASGTEGMTATDLQQAVTQGGRFVIFQFCISVLVLSFKRSSGIIFVRPGESAFVRGLPYSLISLVAGWWGIPWGPIWTISTIVTNLGGGRIVTAQVLQALRMPLAAAPPLPGAVEAPPVQLFNSPPRPARTVLKVVVPLVVAVLLALGWLVYKVASVAGNMPQPPGKAAYRAANENISRVGSTASGNSAAAIELAAQMSQALRLIRDRNFEKSKESSFIDTDDQFKTYCDLRENQCVLLVHVPEMRRFAIDAKKSLGDMAWLTAQGLLKEKALGKADLRLAVGLRGIAAYDRVLTGVYLPDAAEDKSGLTDTRQGFGCEQDLYAWFAPLPVPQKPVHPERSNP